MTSLVSDFIINPVIRQARRFSTGFTTDPESESPSARIAPDARVSGEDAISESEEDTGFLGDALRPPQLPATVTSAASPLPEDALESQRPVGADDGGVPTAGVQNDSADIDATPSIWRSNSIVARNSNGGGAGATSWPYPAPGLIPEDDGKTVLRQRIIGIQNRDIPSSDKARLMHHVLMEGYNQSQVASRSRLAPRTLSEGSSSSPSQHPLVSGALESLKFWNTLRDSSSTPEFVLTEDDLKPTYAPAPAIEDELDTSMLGDDVGAGLRPLGCEHYRRNVKLQCAECDQWYTCRFCHDAVESHTLPRKSTKYMLCMLCGSAQKASDTCSKCGESAARYYCNVCKLWNDDPNKSIYHCNDCGICRIGKGLGKDFYHCKRCIACIAIETETTHKCIERSTDCDCPICGDYMFTSPKTVIFMKCGHSIHDKCWQEYLKTSYKCPICSKSTVNMETQFRNLDIAIASQPMPSEFQNCRAIILCNDCCAKSSTKYHWLGLKCAICNSYNTAQLRLFTEEDVSTDTSIVQAITDPQPGEQGESSEPGPEAFAGGEALAARDIPRPRLPPMHRPGASFGSRGGASTFSPILVPDRLARSVSPIPVAGFRQDVLGGDLNEDMEGSDEDDMIDFWGREEPRNITSAESANETGSQVESDDGSDSADCEDDVEDDDDDEEEISLFGHR